MIDLCDTCEVGFDQVGAREAAALEAGGGFLDGI